MSTDRSRRAVRYRVLLLPAVGVSVVAASLTGLAGRHGASPGQDGDGTPARPAADFVASVGVNVHMYYDDTGYGDLAAVRRHLRELGVRHVRDGLVLGRPDHVRALNALAEDGIRTQLIMGSPDDPPGHLERLVDLAAAELAVAVEAFEGPNEYDRTGDRWQQRLLPYQQELFERVRADRRLRGRPVVGASVGDHDLSQWLDLGNIHPYPGGGPPEPVVTGELLRARSTSGEHPVQATETGYHNAQASSDGHRPVPEDVAAVYLPRLYLEHFRQGLPRTYAYELLDLKPDPFGTDPERHFGLLRVDFSPKPAYTSLKNLLRIVSPPKAKTGPDTAAGSNDDLAYEIEGAPPDLRHLLLEPADGGNWQVVLWRAVSVYDQDEGRPRRVEPESVRVRLPDALAVDLYEPVRSAQPVERRSPSQAHTVEVGGAPVVLEFDPAGG